MKMFLGLTRPSSGDFQIKGLSYPKDRMEILRQTGAFIESPAFYGNLTGEENLEIIRRILKLPKDSVRDALELTGLYEFRKRLASKYSLGMKQRLGLAEALLGRPPVLILDEPTNGLDPAGIHEIRTLIRSLPQKYNCTVLVSSHLLSEIELMADDIGILNHGRLLFEGTLPELKEQAAQMGYPTDNLEDTFLAMIQEDNLNEVTENDPCIRRKKNKTHWPFACFSGRSPGCLCLSGDQYGLPDRSVYQPGPAPCGHSSQWQLGYGGHFHCFLAILGACILYHTEFANRAIEKLYMLPVSQGKVFLCKNLLLLLLFLPVFLIEDLFFLFCAWHWFPGKDPGVEVLLGNTAFSLASILPALLLSTLIASLAKNMWISLGIGVIGMFLGQMSVSYDALFSKVYTFCLPYRCLTSSARAEDIFQILGICAAETVVFAVIKLFLIKIRRQPV